jgi:hypothetical protein
VGKPEGMKLLGRYWGRWENNNKIDVADCVKFSVNKVREQLLAFQDVFAPLIQLTENTDSKVLNKE